MPQPTEDKLAFLRVLQGAHGDCSTVTREQIIALTKQGAPDPKWLWQAKDLRVGGGVYRIPDELWALLRNGDSMGAAAMARVEDVGRNEFKNEEIVFDWNYAAVIPAEDPLYEPFGNYYDVETITNAGRFYPYWIYGLSGIGKTLSIEQAHARLKKKLVMVPITAEADEDSLLGGLRLQDGNTVPFYGPVTMAALMGVTCCLDETDLGDEKMMCLQNPLQNKPYLIKRLGKIVYPRPGFNICATANTKGQGNDKGEFVGTNIMNEAMLDRYVNFFRQEHPPIEVERKILVKFLGSMNHTTAKDAAFIERLLAWAGNIRELHKSSNGTSEYMSTRRLVHICNSYDMFGKDRTKAIRLATGRYKDHVQAAFLDTYKLVDDDWAVKEEAAAVAAAAIAKGVDPETVF